MKSYHYDVHNLIAFKTFMCLHNHHHHACKKLFNLQDENFRSSNDNSFSSTLESCFYFMFQWSWWLWVGLSPFGLLNRIYIEKLTSGIFISWKTKTMGSSKYSVWLKYISRFIEAVILLCPHMMEEGWEAIWDLK